MTPQLRQNPPVACSRWIVIAIVTWAGSAHMLLAQGVTRIRIPATAYASDIMAQADYLQAQGDFLVSASQARKQNAEAAEHEMRNSVQWVHTYFERRRLNREYRAAEDPMFLERTEKRYSEYHRLLREMPKMFVDGTAGDVTDDLNWMLRDLLAHSSYTLFVSGHPDSLHSSPDNAPLTKDDSHHLRLTDGRNVGGKSLVFRADTAEMLETRWPLALRDDRFAATRSAFEAARDSALAELKTKLKLSRSNETRLMQAVDALSDDLNDAYPRQRQATSSKEFLAYSSSKRYLQSLALATYRLIETESQAAFDESYRFRGASVGELLQHMMTRGLEFAPPEPGDEATYRRIFVNVRTLYLRVVPEPKKS